MQIKSEKLILRIALVGFFWDEQLKAAAAKDPRQVRWHPVLIKWCLNLKLLSSSAYHAMKTSGFLKLPSERTLRELVYYFSRVSERSSKAAT